MKLHLVEQVSDKGKGAFYEDRGGYDINHAWVIDGATSVTENVYFDCGTDAEWIAVRMNDLVQKNIGHYHDVPLHEFWKQMSATLRHTVADNILTAMKKYEHPSYAMAMVRLVDDQLHYMLLGDCRIIIKKHNGRIILLNDQLFDDMVAKLREAVEAKTLAEHQPVRSLMNTEEGYWIGAMDGIGFDHAASGVMVMESGDEIILTSDGLMRMAENYQQCSIADIANHSLHDTFRRLRVYENDPDQEINFTKKSDDVFAMRFVVQSKK